MLTIAQALRRRVERAGDNEVAVWFRQDSNESLWTWPRLADETLQTAAALRRLGVLPGDRVAQWAANSIAWITSDLALHLLGAVHVPIHAPLTATQARQQAEHSGANLLLVDRVSRLHELRDAGLNEQAVTTLVHDADSHQQSLAALRRETTPPQRNAIWDEAERVSSPDSLATILYTSGTTGEPKGVMLTQANLSFTAAAVDDRFQSGPETRRFCLLPLSHIFARTCDLYVWILGHGQLGLASSRESIYTDCPAFEATTLNAVPYFFQGLQRRLLDGAKLGELLGPRIEYCSSGGAPLAPELFDFYQTQKMPVLEGYGLTETSPVISACSPGDFRRGSVGRPLPGTEVRIEDGEVQVRGPHVMQGYYRNEAATRETFAGPWLRTGDLGRIDEDGFLYITGRRKELIVMSSGKNIAPTLIEGLLTADPLIEQAMVIGDNRSYLTALICPAPAARADAETRSPDAWEDLLRERMEAVIATRLGQLSHHEQVRRFVLLPRAFSLEHQELTPKLSMRRDRILANWQCEIEAMYAK
ncbi:MAG: long-chain fatty acid--CoA ligase [Planctomycetales bacterium]|nr:long-chain fatty acid--CoA ligase [Planctomycetales bacterium]